MLPNFTNVNFDYLLQHPEVLPEYCYSLRKAISPPNNLVPKSFFANMLGCEPIDLGRIESGHLYNLPLAYRYFLKLYNVYNLFNTEKL